MNNFSNLNVLFNSGGKGLTWSEKSETEDFLKYFLKIVTILRQKSDVHYMRNFHETFHLSLQVIH